VPTKSWLSNAFSDHPGRSSRPLIFSYWNWLLSHRREVRQSIKSTDR
jgi:hypothetical protein